jgi:hypothetical protein
MDDEKEFSDFFFHLKIEFEREINLFDFTIFMKGLNGE